MKLTSKANLWYIFWIDDGCGQAYLIVSDAGGPGFYKKQAEETTVSNTPPWRLLHGSPSGSCHDVPQGRSVTWKL